MKLPLGLYIHFPWCVKKCPYCDFNSHEAKKSIPEQDYIKTLIHDLDRDMKEFKIDSGSQLSSIFMGGGTPSLFSPSSMQSLLTQIGDRFDLHSDLEITLEANPGTTDYEKFVGYREVGINRLSIGVQTFGKAQLMALGRIHTTNEASEAFRAARSAGFDNINIDLMHGLPNQDTQAALFDLETAIELGAEHISWYQLTIEPNTVFYNRPPELPEDDQLWEIFESGTKLLERNNYQRYEVSAFGKPGAQSQHNLNYWQFGDYLGIGAGAHGKVTNDQGSCVRTSKTRKPEDYLANQKVKPLRVDTNEIQLEFLMNALRLTQGFDLNLYQQRTRLDTTTLEGFIQRAMTKKLLVKEADNIVPTELGMQYLNDLLLLAAQD
jgi:putative oxygen-independent coproporphyrinogen III oxidase